LVESGPIRVDRVFGKLVYAVNKNRRGATSHAIRTGTVMNKPCILWKIDYFLQQVWCDKNDTFFGELEKDVRKINNKTDEVLPNVFLLKNGKELKVAFLR
jgi:hypothetical protein